MNPAFKAMTSAQWKGFFRDRQTLFWTILFPLMFLFIFGFVFQDTGQSKSKLVTVGQVSLIDQLPPPAKAAWSELFTVTTAPDEATAVERVRKGEVDGALIQQEDQLTLRFSRADQVKSAVVQGTVTSFVQGANQAANPTPPRYTLDTQQVEDASLKHIQYLAPGLLGWAVAMGATFGAAMGLVQWRTTKLLRRLRLSPVGTWALIGSRTLIALVVAAVQTVIFIGIGMGLFGLRLTGSWWASIPLIAAGTLSFMAIGLLAGAISKTVESASGFANLVIMPMAFLSGSFIPLDAAPDWLRTVSKFLPLGHLNEGMLDVMVRGQGTQAVLMPIAVLIGFTLVIGAVAAKLFRWED